MLEGMKAEGQADVLLRTRVCGPGHACGIFCLPPSHLPSVPQVNTLLFAQED